MNRSEKWDKEKPEIKISNIVISNWVKTVEELKKDFEQDCKNPVLPLDDKIHTVIKDDAGNISVDGIRIWTYEDLK